MVLWAAHSARIEEEPATYEPRRLDRLAAQRWAQELLRRDDWVILDTETTGLRHTDEVIQIGLLAPDGSVLLDTLLHPRQPIPWDASRIHGITDGHVVAAPQFGDIRTHLQAAVTGRTVIAYNAAFDERLILQTAFAHRVPTINAAWECAMRQYSRYVGTWSARHGNYSWQPLPRPQGQAARFHQALDDCRATLDVIRAMAAG